MINIINDKAEINKNSVPYNWIEIKNTFSDVYKNSLTKTYPSDNYRTIFSNSKDRQYNYYVRALVSLSGNIQHKDSLSESWKLFSEYLISDEYRKFISKSSGIDVSKLRFEANIYKYHKDCFMDAHQDLSDKIITHVIYFNEEWNESDGGCINILNSKNERDVFKKILPVAGNSIMIIRSDNSWHSIDKTICNKSRRSVTVTFYKAGSNSPMWIQGEKYELNKVDN